MFQEPSKHGEDTAPSWLYQRSGRVGALLSQLAAAAQTHREETLSAGVSGKAHRKLVYTNTDLY